jgi:hypothetical protein
MGAHACACCCRGSCGLEGSRLERTDVKLPVATEVSGLSQSEGFDCEKVESLQLKGMPWLSYSPDCVCRHTRYRGHEALRLLQRLRGPRILRPAEAISTFDPCVNHRR